MDKLKENHKIELKELQARVQQMKHSVPKGDKKMKKQIMAEIAMLQAKMEEKHQSEIIAFEKTKNDESQMQDDLSGDFSSININENHGIAEQKKVSRAQKRRERKEEEEKIRQQRLAQAEVENVNSDRNLESKKFNEMMLQRGFVIKEIAPDGNCLYNAIADQLLPCGEYEWSTLRSLTADTLRKNKEQFIPFMTNQDTGEPFSEDEYEKYCEEVDTTNTWGGQIEIQALSSVLQQPIEIFQADLPILKIGEHLQGKTIRLSYHKHAYGLGEHYNSVLPKEE